MTKPKENDIYQERQDRAKPYFEAAAEAFKKAEETDKMAVKFKLKKEGEENWAKARKIADGKDDENS